MGHESNGGKRSGKFKAIIILCILLLLLIIFRDRLLELYRSLLSSIDGQAASLVE